MAAKGPNAAAIAKLLAQANALSKPGGDIALAIEKLTECHALATNAPPGPDLAAFQAKARQVKALIEQLGPDYDFREQDLAYVDEVLAMADSMPDEILRVLDEKEQIAPKTNNGLPDQLRWRRLTRNCASERARAALTAATSSEDIASRRRAAAS